MRSGYRSGGFGTPWRATFLERLFPERGFDMVLDGRLIRIPRTFGMPPLDERQQLGIDLGRPPSVTYFDTPVVVDNLTHEILSDE